MTIKKYCIYFPYRLDIETLEKITNIDNLYTSIKTYLLFNEDLDNQLSTIMKFVRFNQESELSLLKKEDKIYAVVFSRDGYKPFNILPVINDMDHMQCFIAVSNTWVSLDEISQEIKVIDKDVNYIQSLFDVNKPKLIPLIEYTIDKLFQQYLFIKENNISL